MKKNKNGYLTIPEAAELLNISTRTMYQWVWDGEVPARKIGGSWRIRKSDIEALWDKK